MSDATPNPGGYPTDDPRHGLSSEELRDYYASRSPQYLVRGTYGPGAEAKREAAMEDHLAYIRARRDQLRFAGPLLSDDGSTPTGSYAIIDVAERSEAEAYIEGESFNQAGMFSDIEIKRFSSSMQQRQADLTADPSLAMFICECIDQPDVADLRERTGPAHHAFQQRVMDRFVARGPILSDDGRSVTGSLFIIQVPDRAAAQALIESEPMTDAGVFGKIRIDRWRFGNALG